MDTSILSAKIRRHADAIRATGVTALYIFGSRARGNAGPDSDLDAFVDFDAARKFSLLDLVKVEQLLERELGMPVDLTTRNSLSPLLRPLVEASAVRVI
jgi:hypothetical protein